MENKRIKNKEAIIIIVLVVLLILIVGGLFIYYYIQTNKETTNIKDNKQQENVIYDEKENTNLEQEEIQNEQKEDSTEKKEEIEKDNNTFDPYEKYKHIEWSTTSAKIEEDVRIEIKNGEVYVTYAEETSKVKGIKGTPKKVVAFVSGGICTFRILTEEGKIYGMSDLGATIARLDDRLDNIQDMTTNAKGVVYNPVYFLTRDGKLIDIHGDTFEDLNRNFTDSCGTLGITVYLDKDNYIYYTKNERTNYLVVKDTKGNKVKAKEIYFQNEDIAIVITEDNQMIYVTNEGKVIYEKGKIKTINTYNSESSTIMLVLMNNNKNVIKYGLYSFYYDVEKQKNIDIKEGDPIEYVYVYKTKEETNNEYYENKMILSKEQIKDVEVVLVEAEKNASTDLDGEMYKVVIKFKTGMQSIIKVYAGSRISWDGEVYSLEGQTIEVFDTIAYKFQWE